MANSINWMNRRAFTRRLAALTTLGWLGAPIGVAAQNTDVAPAASDPSFTSRGGEILFRAMSLLGTRYRRGGNSPETGFDCSGFVGYLFRDVMGKTLPRSAHEIWRHGDEIGSDEVEPGDLVFYDTLHRRYSHVGIFIDDGKFIHAPAAGGVVRTEKMSERYWARRWNGARRVGT